MHTSVSFLKWDQPEINWHGYLESWLDWEHFWAHQGADNSSVTPPAEGLALWPQRSCWEEMCSVHNPLWEQKSKFVLSVHRHLHRSMAKFPWFLAAFIVCPESWEPPSYPWLCLQEDEYIFLFLIPHSCKTKLTRSLQALSFRLCRATRWAEVTSPEPAPRGTAMPGSASRYREEPGGTGRDGSAACGSPGERPRDRAMAGGDGSASGTASATASGTGSGTSSGTASGDRLRHRLGDRPGDRFWDWLRDGPRDRVRDCLGVRFADRLRDRLRSLRRSPGRFLRRSRSWSLRASLRRSQSRSPEPVHWGDPLRRFQSRSPEVTPWGDPRADPLSRSQSWSLRWCPEPISEPVPWGGPQGCHSACWQWKGILNKRVCLSLD